MNTGLVLNDVSADLLAVFDQYLTSIRPVWPVLTSTFRRSTPRRKSILKYLTNVLLVFDLKIDQYASVVGIEPVFGQNRLILALNNVPSKYLALFDLHLISIWSILTPAQHPAVRAHPVFEQVSDQCSNCFDPVQRLTVNGLGRRSTTCQASSSRSNSSSPRPPPPPPPARAPGARGPGTRGCGSAWRCGIRTS